MEINYIIDKLNNNSGTLSLVIFLVSLVIGWGTGIFRALIKKPKFKIRVIPKMTFCSNFLTGDKYTPPGLGTYDLHKTAFVTYLEITNIGSAASNLGKLRIGYYKDDGKSTWFQKRQWINESNILDDFGIPISDGQTLKIPHLKQLNVQYDQQYDGYLEIGKSTIGTAYFEQVFSWGNHYPRVDKQGNIQLKVVVEDAFGSTYSKKYSVPVKTIQESLRYNPKFGFTEHLLNKDSVVDNQADMPKEDSGGEVE
jgi:hypothetical protein